MNFRQDTSSIHDLKSIPQFSEGINHNSKMVNVIERLCSQIGLHVALLRLPRTPIRALLTALVIAGLPATAGAPAELSTNGIGAATFGMSFEAVERALGSTLLLNPETSRSKLHTLECVYAKVGSLPGVELLFDKGRFAYVAVSKPTLATRSGLKVGDPERLVIERFKSDPTFYRGLHGDSDTEYEILVGQGRWIDNARPDGPQAHGRNIRFFSEKGRVTRIWAGEAGWVLLKEFDVDCH
jgi:hypothetical protein